jgi:hypothetical protein
VSGAAGAPPRPPRATIRRIAFATGAALLGVAAAAGFAEPVMDGDLFWHLAYARQMIEGRTWIPDATIYSWTPASGAMIYCAWLAQLALHLVWSAGGADAIFAMRYAALGLVVAMLWHQAARHELAASPWTPPAIALALLAAAPVFPGKPELVSVVFTHALLWLFEGARDAERRGRPAAPWLWAVPALVLVWANAHGGFILAAPVMLALAAGDMVNARLAPALALSPRARRTLVLAWTAAALATVATPYGFEYPRQLVADYVLGATPRPDVAWNAAHQSPLGPAGWALHLPEYGAAMLVVLGALALRRIRSGAPLDAVVPALLAVAVPLFVLYLRSTYLLPAVFGFAVFVLAGGVGAARRAPGRSVRAPVAGTVAAASVAALAAAVTGPVAGAVAPVGATALLAARVVHEARCAPRPSGWPGPGIGYANPVDEAEWLARHAVGPRLYNTFDSGGYLLWRLYPAYRVMTDSRSFPYLAWFEDQRAFTQGERVDEVMARYPADAAIIDLKQPNTWRHLLRRADWRPVHFGPTAVVFVRADDPRAAGLAWSAAGTLDTLRNGTTALAAFDFAVDAGDWASAERLGRRIGGALRCQFDARVVEAVERHLDGLAHARAGRWTEAARDLDRGLARKVAGDRDRALRTMVEAMTRIADPQSPRARAVRAGIEQLLAQRR